MRIRCLLTAIAVVWSFGPAQAETDDKVVRIVCHQSFRSVDPIDVVVIVDQLQVEHEAKDEAFKTFRRNKKYSEVAIGEVVKLDGPDFMDDRSLGTTPDTKARLTLFDVSPDTSVSEDVAKSLMSGTVPSLQVDGVFYRIWNVHDAGRIAFEHQIGADQTPGSALYGTEQFEQYDRPYITWTWHKEVVLSDERGVVAEYENDETDERILFGDCFHVFRTKEQP